MRIPKSRFDALKDKYLSGKSSTHLSEEFGVCSATIVNTLRRIGVKIRSTGEAARKYPIVESFFDDINTQKKAYFLGYLFADGCNTEEHVSLNLSEKDLGMLKKFNILVHPKGKPLYKGHARVVKSKHKALTALSKTSYHLVMESKHISEVLSKYGCVPRKTDVLKFPEMLKHDMLPHFIRGYFDGDGSVSLYGRRDAYIQAYVSIVSTRFFCKSLQDILKKELEIKSKLLEKHYEAENVVEFRIINTAQVLKFLEWIYKGSTIHLHRKYMKYKQLLKNRKYLTVVRKCCLCTRKYYGKGYCNKHYQYYTRKVVALLRARKALLEYLTISKIENPEKHLQNIIKKPPKLKIPYRPRTT